MKIWLSNDGKSSGGKRFFARVEEVMVDKNGKPVYVPTPASMQVVEPAVEPAPVVEPVAPAAPVAPAEPTSIKMEPIRVVVETTPIAPVAPVVQMDNGMLELLGEVVGKCDAIIDLLANSAREVVIQEVVDPAPAEEPAEEPAPAEEIAATEAVEPAQEPENTFVFMTTEEPAPVEEPAIEPAPVEPVAEFIPVVVPAEETAPVEIAPVPVEEAPKAPAVRSRCFAEKMRDASEILQDRYDELKNYALRFRKLKSRISRKFDSINQGRFQFVKLGVAGKTLKLYLNMDINTTDPKFHCKDMSDKKTYVTVPTMLRIKSGRAVKYAKILIDQCAEQHGMLERRKPVIVDAMALIEEALAAKDLPEGADADTDVDVNGDAE